MLPEVKAAFEQLEKLPVSSPIITAFLESTNFEDAIAERTGSGFMIIAPGNHSSNKTTLVLSDIAGWSKIEKVLELALVPSSFSDFFSEGFEFNPAVIVESGTRVFAFSAETGGVPFGIGTKLENNFDPTDPRHRWFLEVVNRVGELTERYINDHGLPPSPELSKEELGKVIMEITDTMRRLTDEKIQELGQDPS